MTPSLLLVSPSRASSARDLPALETAMHALALDTRSPIALELAATATSRPFLLRAAEPLALRHLAQQIQARYPQAVIGPAATDPLMRAPGEECSVCELCPGASSDLPLRSWKARDLLSEGTDPLLGILAACGELPKDLRAIVQLALVPASPTWSAGLLRRAVEHPLEQERARERLGSASSAPGGGRIIALGVLVLLLTIAFRFRLSLSRLLPPWLLAAGAALAQGKATHLTTRHTIEVTISGIVLLFLLLAVLYAGARILARLRQPALYDQRLVAEKTARAAYRVRLRLYVIGPGEAWPGRRLRSQPGPSLRDRARTGGRRWKRWAARGRLSGLHAAWHRERARLRGWQRRQVADRARQARREEVLRMLTASYRQYHLAAGGYFVPKTLSARRVHRLLSPPSTRLFRRTGWSADVARSSHLLSVADLAALWHLPQAHDLADLPYVERSVSRTLLAPALLATGDGYPLGVSTHAGQTLPVFLPFSCLQQNLLAVASTGKGKSTLFAHLLQAFAQARVAGSPEGSGGALLVDPHGDLAEQVAGSLPASLAEDILLIRLSDREYPIGFNPLDMSQGQDRDKTIDNLIAVIEALWPTSYGPRTESFVEYGCKSLAEANVTLLTRDPLQGPEEQFTLLDAVPLFRNDRFRHAVLELVHDQHLLDWWNHYYEPLDGRQQADFTSSLITKLSKFASSRISRRILGQPRSSLSFAEIIRQRKILLLSCAAGEVGSDLAALFGSLYVGFFQTALQEQASLAPTERHRFLVLIDEFQFLAGIPYQTMLAELRKYGGSFALATQSLAYLDRFERTLRATVLANVEQIFAFALAHDDARLLHVPGVEPEDILHLPDYACYARLSQGGQRLPVFSLHLAAPEEASPDRRQEVVSRSRSRHGRPVGVVDQALLASQTRQRTMRPRHKRTGGKGYEVLWEGTGEERVAEVFEQMRATERPHIRGKGVQRREEAAFPPHTMFTDDAARSRDPVPSLHEEEEDAKTQQHTNGAGPGPGTAASPALAGALPVSADPGPVGRPETLGERECGVSPPPGTGAAPPD